jgi:hypothetical protein
LCREVNDSVSRRRFCRLPLDRPVPHPTTLVKLVRRAGPEVDLLGYDPSTVRRWIHRYHTHGTPGLADRPRSGRPRLGSSRLGQRIRRLLTQPRAWTIGRLCHALGRPPLSRHTLHRRVREGAAWRRPRLVARGDPDRDQVLGDLQQQVRDLPEGAVVLAGDETTSTCWRGCARPGSSGDSGSGS